MYKHRGLFYIASLQSLSWVAYATDDMMTFSLGTLFVFITIDWYARYLNEVEKATWLKLMVKQ